MRYLLKSSVFLGALGSAMLLQQACSNAEMAGGGAAAQKSKKKPTIIGDDPTSPPGESGCKDASAAAYAGQSVDLELSGFDPSATVTVQDNFGTAAINKSVLTYTAPAMVPSARDILLTVSSGTVSKTCKVKLFGAGDILIPDDGATRALLANVYKLVHGPGAARLEVYDLPDLTIEDKNKFTKYGDLYIAPNLNVPGRIWDQGFPKYPELTEWFAIRFYGKIEIPDDGPYTFKFESLDDGAKLFIDGSMVLNWDHLAWEEVVRTRQPNTVTLTKGSHTFRVDYFQGPRNALGVILKWKKPGDADFSVVPASVFDRPD